MARIEWVKQRLDNWALWKVTMTCGGLGFASQSSFLNDAPGETRAEARIPIDEVEASVTDEAIETLKLPRPQIYRTLQCIYPRGMGIKATALEFGGSVSTVKAHLDTADNVLAVWFRERAEQQAARREAIRKSFTT